MLRVIAAGAAATAVVGAAVMRRWDTQAGKQVADLTRARASDEWRHEERVAELETDLEESRELRAKLEQRLRAKRAELAGLRNEHAALLRRYATAETERASALEGRRLLEIETGSPARALPPVPAAGTVTAKTAPVPEETEAVAASADVSEGTADEPAAPAIFSPEGSKLFLRAKAALKKFDEDGDGSPKDDGGADGAADSQDAASAEAEDGTGPEDDDSPKGGGSPKGDEPAKDVSPKGEPVTVKAGSDSAPAQTAATGTVAVEPAATGEAEAAAQEDESQGQPQAVDGHERAAATTEARQVPAAQPVQQPAGHFVAPTAVAVVPAAPVRRPAVEGGFDFFGTKSEGARDALEAVQNEDLADVVGQEALAVHKAEAEAEFKPADKEAPAVGQVIDLTAHDETEQIDLQGLRSAVS